MANNYELQTIAFDNFEVFKEEIERKKKRDVSLVINSDDDKKFVKKQRAQANKEFADFKAKSKQIRDTVIGGFDDKVKEVKDLYDSWQNGLKENVEQYDEKFKADRLEFIRKTITLYVKELDFVELNSLHEKSYLNTTVTESKIIESVSGKVAKIRSDLAVAQAISPQVAELYKRTLDVPEAIRIDKEQQAEVERRRLIEEAEQARLEQARLDEIERQNKIKAEEIEMAEIEEARSNGEVIDAERVMEAKAVAKKVMAKREVKKATFTISFEYTDDNYPLAWETPLTDLQERLQGLTRLDIKEI